MGVPSGRVLAWSLWPFLSLACSGGETLLGGTDGGGAEDVPAAEDAAEEDAAADEDAEAEVDGSGGYEFDFYVLQGDEFVSDLLGPPIEGAIVAIDLPSGREEVLSGADGGVHVVMPLGAAEVTLTAAKVGWLPVTTIYRARISEIEERIAAEGQLYAVLWPSVVPPSRSRNVVVTSTGTTSFRAAVDFGDTEPAAGTWRRVIDYELSRPTELVAYSIDPEGCPVEFFETSFPDMLVDQSAVIPFDGTGPTTAARTDLTLRLPEDPTSVFRTRGVFTGRRFPVFVVGDRAVRGVIRGGACAEEVAPDGASLQVSVRWLPPASGDVTTVISCDTGYGADWAVDPFSARAMAGPPVSGTYDVLDIPRAIRADSEAPTLTSTFLAPEVAGAEAVDLIVTKGLEGQEREQLRLVRSFRRQDITPPALPAGYDRSVDWPTRNRAKYRIRTCEAPVASSLLWPQRSGSNCSYSVPVVGTFE